MHVGHARQRHRVNVEHADSDVPDHGEQFPLALSEHMASQVAPANQQEHVDGQRDAVNIKKRVDHQDDRVYIRVTVDHRAYLQHQEAC